MLTNILYFSFNIFNLLVKNDQNKVFKNIKDQNEDFKTHTSKQKQKIFKYKKSKVRFNPQIYLLKKTLRTYCGMRKKLL